MPAAELDEARRARAAEKTRRNRARKPEVYGQHQHKANLKRRYGISPEMYAEMLERQEGVCAICGGVNKSGQRLSYDHCHTTLEARGLLCGPCNQAIGLLRDNPELIRRAAQYVAGKL